MKILISSLINLFIVIGLGVLVIVVLPEHTSSFPYFVIGAVIGTGGIILVRLLWAHRKKVKEDKDWPNRKKGEGKN